jgi:hypothetical protein
MRKLVALALFGLLSLPTLASAMQRSEDDCAKQRKLNKGKCELKIEGDDVVGNHARPLGERGEGRPELKSPSLIRLRTDFTDRIVASAEHR